ncbi:MAG TPA: prenyltransferase/squalene oxidase repeat-containing protein, partial [Gemmataceae bacterium]
MRNPPDRTNTHPRAILAVFLIALTVGIGPASSAGVRAAPDPKEVRAVIEKGVAYLRTAQQPDGSFAPKAAGPGVTALAVVALLRAGYTPDDPMVAKALRYLEKNVRPDGGVYAKGLANYTTSLAVLAFKLANRDGRYDGVIAGATKFLKKLQFGDSTDPDDPRFGGVGYGGRERPDLSNTQYFVEALVEAGVPKDDPAVQQAVVFLSRCQNLPSEQNKLAYAAKATPEDRGGFVYNPLDADKEDNPRRTPQGGLRSEGG